MLDLLIQSFPSLTQIDTGSHRAGVPSIISQAYPYAKTLHDSVWIDFVGLYSHSGHTYNGKTPEEVLKVVDEEIQQQVTVARGLIQKGISVKLISVGSTPSAEVMELQALAKQHLQTYLREDDEFKLEIHAGNYGK